MATNIRVQLPPYSMWGKTRIYPQVVGGENVIVFGLLQDMVAPDASDQVFTVPRAGVNRLDLISQNFYGVPDLWPVIARVNGILDPMVGFSEGDVIQVPTRARLALLG